MCPLIAAASAFSTSGVTANSSASSTLGPATSPTTAGSSGSGSSGTQTNTGAIGGVVAVILILLGCTLVATSEDVKEEHNRKIPGDGYGIALGPGGFAAEKAGIAQEERGITEKQGLVAHASTTVEADGATRYQPHGNTNNAPRELP